MSHFITLYEAKTHFSGLVDRAAAGEEIIIAKNGVPQARLVPLASCGERRQPAKKKLDFRDFAVAAIGANGFHELPILPIDAENSGALAWQHNDPFDRMLVAQARRLTFTLATTDAAIRAYANVAQIWVG